MIAKRLEHTKKQHTIPKCYLKNFSEDGKRIYKKSKTAYIDGKTLQQELKTPISLKTATTVNDFYTVKNCNEPMMVETLIYAREIENCYPNVYKTLINPAIKDFGIEERAKILTCLLSLHCKTPKQFKLFFETIKEKINSDELEKTKNDYKVAHLHKILPSFIEAHQFKIIKIYKAIDSSEFITSDNPVLILGRDNCLKNNIFKSKKYMNSLFSLIKLI